MSDGSPYEFDTATAVRPGADPGRYDVDIDPGWAVGPKPNGGYLVAVAGRAATRALAAEGSGHADPVAATTHFLRAPDPGPAQIRVDVLRTGRSASQVQTTISQDDRPCVTATFTVATLATEPGEAWWSNRPPVEVAPFADCIRLPGTRDDAPFPISIMDRCDLRLDPADLGFTTGRPSGRAELRGWIAFADGRPVDALGLHMITDALPPATFDLVQTGWVPTLTITAYVRALPAPGPLRIRQIAQVVDHDRFDEVCEVWDAGGRLVAQATQLAAIRLPET